MIFFIFFCLWRSPDHGMIVDVVGVLLFLLLLGATFVLSDLSRYRKTYKNKSVYSSDIRYCAKFQPLVASSIFAKNCQNDFTIFCNFAVFFAFFDFKNDLKIQIWPDPPNIIWGCPIFLGLKHFLYNHSLCLKTLF